MRYLLFLISFLLLSPAWAGEGLDVQGWARATATKARNGAAYITIKNLSGSGDRLLYGKSLVAKSAALHNHYGYGRQRSRRDVQDAWQERT